MAENPCDTDGLVKVLDERFEIKNLQARLVVNYAPPTARDIARLYIPDGRISERKITHVRDVRHQPSYSLGVGPGHMRASHCAD
ncbi:uncharacterized protein PADG_12102 [Paracoccidioides brasiliensis Pb18]|uniref:Uncharacterized protein n=1 Tax=Paracoccidioides brasiliensis (strain Pb18) TaxID=502780 RepID=A0A0A0HU20_PARBD|nr:uncharacterized protein PADG_12102 [Paracoccidioides brasiliensis Pb18]KGM91788.1 hypothetical protein PADG_12102 [Paracoccidioides brasiliensis Pb18]ODH46688.1 hypothetical protein GX48_07245 [Paracoccidioides brasiliensis]